MPSIRCEADIDMRRAGFTNVIIHKSDSQPTEPTGGLIWYDSVTQLYRYYHEGSGAFYPFAATGRFYTQVRFSDLVSGTGISQVFIVGSGATLGYGINGTVDANLFWGSPIVMPLQGGLGTADIYPSSILYGQGNDPIGLDLFFVYDPVKHHLGVGNSDPQASIHIGTGYGPAFLVAPKTLEPITIDNTIEYDGSGYYYTDSYGGRHLFATSDMSLGSAFTDILPISKGGTYNSNFSNNALVQSSGTLLMSVPSPTGANGIPVQGTGDVRLIRGSVTGQVIGWSPTGWGTYNVVIPISSGTFSVRSDTIAQHSGVTLGTLASGQFFRYNGVGFTNSTGVIQSSEVSDFNEAVDDRVGALITNGTCIQAVYNDAGNTLALNLTGVVQHGLLYVSSAPSSILSTNVETNFAQSYTIPTTNLASGAAFRVKANGYYGTDGAASTTLQFKIKGNSVVLGDSTAKNNGLGATNRGWTLEDTIIVNAVGATGLLECQGYCAMSTSATAAGFCDMENTGVITVNMTGGLTLQISATHQNSLATNTATMRQFLIERIF